MSDQQWQEAKAPQYPSVRWNEQPQDEKQAQTTVYLGTIVQGLLIDRKSGLGANNSSIYNIQLADGRIVGVWGSHALDAKMAIVPNNHEVRIEFLGLVQNKKPGQKPWKNFSVQYAKPVTTMTEAQAPNAGFQAPPVGQAPSNMGY